MEGLGSWLSAGALNRAFVLSHLILCLLTQVSRPPDLINPGVCLLLAASLLPLAPTPGLPSPPCLSGPQSCLLRGAAQRQTLRREANSAPVTSLGAENAGFPVPEKKAAKSLPPLLAPYSFLSLSFLYRGLFLSSCLSKIISISPSPSPQSSTNL